MGESGGQKSAKKMSRIIRMTLKVRFCDFALTKGQIISHNS
jgi:hypothetical protein